MRRVCFFLFSLVLLGVGTILAQDSNSYLIEGDAAYDNLDNESALKFYQLAYKTDTTHCEAAWKISRAMVDIGELSDKAKQEEYYLDAEKWSHKSIRLCPDLAKAHLSLAIAVGRVALISGKKKQVELSTVVKQSCERALELDPNDDIAHHVYARWHRKVANLSGIQKTFAKILYGGLPKASNEQAIEHFQKAIALKPNYINHHLELGITYQEMDQFALAKSEYEKIADLPITDSEDPDHKKEALARLAEVEKKLK